MEDILEQLFKKGIALGGLSMSIKMNREDQEGFMREFVSRAKSDLLNGFKKNEKPYFECSSCEINSETKGRMCPCPRGSCEAEQIGKIITTTKTERILFKSKDDAEWKEKKFTKD